MKLKKILLFAIVSVFAANCELSFAGDEVYYPAGEFWMGSAEAEGQPNQHPRHKVYLDAFAIDRYEVTGKDFEAYLAVHPKKHPTITGWYDRKVRRGMDKLPVIGLTWQRCVNYCAWRDKRLPTEAEWERAAAGLTNRRYPWGNEPLTSQRANFNKCCFIMGGDVLEDVGHYPLGKTPEGVYNMAGNIAEWVHDWYDKNYYKNSEYKNPRGPEKGKYHTIRGGAWNSLAHYMKSANRYGDNDGKDFYGIGCRCARSVSASEPTKKATDEN